MEHGGGSTSHLALYFEIMSSHPITNVQHGLWVDINISVVNKILDVLFNCHVNLFLDIG
jgi:hypothetical protein